MFERSEISAASKPQAYAELERQLAALLDGEHDLIANLANMSALLYHSLPELNWVGFYLARDGQLVLGPFQGKPACVRIPFGRGVCGTAAATRQTQRVADVDAFPGHIACDAASRSELVIPLVKNGDLFGVLDLDAPVVSRFDADDQAGLERLAALLLNAI